MKAIPPLRSATILSLVRSVDREGLMQKSILQRMVWALDDGAAIDIAQIVLDIAADEHDEMHAQWVEVAGKIKLHQQAVAQAEAVGSEDAGDEQVVTAPAGESQGLPAGGVATLKLDPIGLSVDPSGRV